jgi:hypothetical protein
VAQLHDIAVGLDDLVGVARPQRDQPEWRCNDKSCSTGWWVGPSSPSPIASCVKMKIEGSSIKAASRIGRARNR